MKPRVFVVALNWNGQDIIGECLDSLKKQSQTHKVVVVDNGSKDGSAELIEQNYPEVHLIKEQKNHGFAGGVNIGIRYALKQGAVCIALINNDAVAEPGWLKLLVQRLKNDEKIGIVTCKFKRDDKKRFDSTGDFYTTRGIAFPRGRNELDTGQYDKPEEIFGASGGASLYRAELFEDIGLFDEKFFAYLEDVDISFRSRLRGWKIWYEPKAVAYHKVSATSSRLGNFSYYHSLKNFYFLYFKNMPTRLVLRYFHSFVYQVARSLASAILNRRILVYLKAHFYVVRNLGYLLGSRKKIQGSKNVSAPSISRWLIKGKPPRIPYA